MCNESQYTLPKISFIAGTTREIKFRSLHYTDRRQFNLDGYNANFKLIEYMNKDGVHTLEKPMTIESGQMACVTLNSSDTINLDDGRYIYQVTITANDNNEAVEVQQGIMDIHKNIVN